MNLNSVTPLILTSNEATNIGDTLDRLRWAQQVVVIDSYSDDATVGIANCFENVDVKRRRFDNHTAQWNFGLAQIATDWVLTLDADYRCPRALADEIRLLDDDCDAYTASFIYGIYGTKLSGALYPSRAVLFRPKKCHYIQDGHTQLLVHDIRRTRRLRTKLLHDDRKSLSTWLVSQAKYADLEARKLAETSFSQLGWKDRIRRWYFIAPVLTFFYCLIVKRLIFDGRAGLYYTLQRVYAELLLSLKLLDRAVQPATAKHVENSSAKMASLGDSDSADQYELSHTRN